MNLSDQIAGWLKKASIDQLEAKRDEYDKAMSSHSGRDLETKHQLRAAVEREIAARRAIMGRMR